MVEQCAEGMGSVLRGGAVLGGGECAEGQVVLGGGECAEGRGCVRGWGVC